MNRALHIASLACLLSMAHGALAHPTSIGYLYDAEGQLVRSGFGSCIRTGEWAPDNALAECDAAPSKKEPAVTTPATSTDTPAESLDVSLGADELFDSGKAELKPAAKARLIKLANDLKSIAYDSILITGHADRTGPQDLNRRLSEYRANAVHNFLVSEGITTEKMSSTGKGSSQPVTKPGECDKLKSVKLQACLAPDRRVEIRVSGARAK
ncbi:MAG: OmpA family protein [Nitrosomonadales bacterium]|nr:OmpA family protein [Nitrosomonadales bacterium]